MFTCAVQLLAVRAEAVAQTFGRYRAGEADGAAMARPRCGDRHPLVSEYGQASPMDSAE